MRLNRIMIAAPKSGSGKTLITCGLLKALKDKGQNVVSYKCGPDYIDPMFHQKVIEIPSKNLDTFFTGEQETKRLFLKGRTKEDFVVLEGVMGLFDGLGGIREEGSTYHLAKLTKTPVILVVDAKGMGRSVIPLIAGFLAYDTEKLIKGIILNRMSRSYYEVIKPLIEKELEVCVVGYFPEHKELHIESRHLGLTMPDEQKELKKTLQVLSDELQKTVSMEQILQLAMQAPDIEDGMAASCGESSCEKPLQEKIVQEKSMQEKIVQEKIVQEKSMQEKSVCGAVACLEEQPVIAVAKDEAFCFYYEDNLALLQEFGARIVYFSPLHDTRLPDGCCGILLGGGYPELYAKELSDNKAMREEIKKAIDRRIPLVAECGGFMYLHAYIQNKEGQRYDMVGANPAGCFDTGRLVRFGYVEVEEQQANFLPKGTKIRGHEFHYFDSMYNGESCVAVKPTTQKSYSCIITEENVWMGFPHLYYPSNPEFAKNFVMKAGKFMKRRKGAV